MKGNQFYSLGDNEQAIECYARAIKLNPADPLNYSNRAMANLKIENYELVVKDATKAIKLDPESIKAYHRRGKAHLAMDLVEKAILDFEFCASRNPNDPEFLDCLSKSHERNDELMRERGDNETD